MSADKARESKARKLGNLVQGNEGLSQEQREKKKRRSKPRKCGECKDQKLRDEFTDREWRKCNKEGGTCDRCLALRVAAVYGNIGQSLG